MAKESFLMVERLAAALVAFHEGKFEVVRSICNGIVTELDQPLPDFSEILALTFGKETLAEFKSLDEEMDTDDGREENLRRSRVKETDITIRKLAIAVVAAHLNDYDAVLDLCKVIVTDLDRDFSEVIAEIRREKGELDASETE